MKHLILVFSILCLGACLAGSAAAQSQQQPDSLPQGPGWHVIYQSDTIGFASVSFPTADTGYVLAANPITYARYVLKTTDSGSTWTITAMPDYYSNICFTSAEVGYLNGSQNVWKTNNGGASWTSHPTGLSGFENSMVFPCRDTGFVAGAGNISRTTDAGETWQAYNNSLGGCDVISFSDHLNGYFGGQVGTSPADSGREHAANFASTTDGGATWIPTYSHLSYDIQSIYSPKPHVIIAGIANGVLARSTDDGWTWDMTNAVTTLGDLFSAISFSDTLHGLAVIAGAIAYTSDGGMRWIKHWIPMNGSWQDAQLLANGTVYMVSAGGTIVANRDVEHMSVDQQVRFSLDVQVFPNPGHSQIQFSYNIPQLKHVTFQIFSTTGALISSLVQSVLQSGPQQLTLSTLSIPAGDYLYQLSAEDYQASGTFTVIK